MLAFALCSSHLPEWSLRLVGPVDEKFHPFIEKYFAARPELRERVFFTGEISDKAELYREYARAKIFALTSKSEGGAPNVYAEALRHGCMFITSDIDAADDITDGGELGLIYRYGDTDGLAGAILRLCGNAGLEDVRRHIPKALGYAAKFYDWNRNAKKLAFALMR